MTGNLQPQKRSDWLQKQVSTKPKNEKTAAKVTHAE